MTRKLVLLLAVLTLAAPLAHADDASKRVKIKEMFVAMKMNAMMKQVMTQSAAQGQQMAKSMFGDRPIPAADQKIMDDYTAKSMALMGEALDWDKLEPEYTTLYANAYTEEEVEGILAFYRSPVGQAMVQKNPDLLTKSGQLVTARVQIIQPRLQELTRQFVQQISAAHQDEKPAK